MEITRNKYYLTIRSKSETICRRIPFDDFALALEECSKYFESKAKLAVQTLNTEVTQGKFARAYSELNLSKDLEDFQDQIGELRFRSAVKTENSFKYDNSYFFLIESDFGIKDTKEFNDD